MIAVNILNISVEHKQDVYDEERHANLSFQLETAGDEDQHGNDKNKHQDEAELYMWDNQKFLWIHQSLNRTSASIDALQENFIHWSYPGCYVLTFVMKTGQLEEMDYFKKEFWKQ